jgi:caa(3)-type oxidase subunit IV
MTESHGHGPHAGPTLNAYLVVFAALSVFTVVSFVVNGFVQQGSITAMTGLVIIMMVAIVKATLVTMFFMHLKWDWVRLYFIIIPLMILTVMLMVVLMPDTVLGWPSD